MEKRLKVNTNCSYSWLKKKKNTVQSEKNWGLFGGSWIKSPARCKSCCKLTEGEKGAEEETGTSQRAVSHSLIFIVLLGRVRLVKLV